MRKLLIILCILFFSTPCLANQIIIGKKKTGASCTELVSLGGAGGSTKSAASGSGLIYYAFQFTAGDWGTVSKMQVYLEETGNVDGIDWDIALYNDLAGNNEPDETNQVSNGKCSFSGTDFSSTGYFGCVLSTPVQLTNTSSYHLVFCRTDHSYDASNYFKIHYNASGSYYLTYSTSGAAWSDSDTSSEVVMKLFTGTCTGH